MLLNILRFLIPSFLIFVSCGPSQEEINRELILEAYTDIANYAEKNNIKVNRGHKSGYVSGDALFRFSSESIAVNYSVSQYQEIEIGDLDDLYVSDYCGMPDCNDIYPISIRGRWNSRVAGDGDFNLAVSNSTVYFHIIGDGSWSHFMEFELPSTEYVVERLNELYTAIIR